MALFDKDLALSQAGGSTELAQELFGMLIKDLPLSLTAAETAHASHDKEAFWNAIHKVHGGTAYCGVPDLKEACKNLEDEIKSQYPGENIDTALQKFKKEVSNILNGANEFSAML